MLQDELHLSNYIRIIRKRQWIIITFFVIVVASVTISSFLQTPVYKSTARVLIEKENPNVLSFKEVLALDTADTDYYQTQYTILRSRSLAKEVLQRVGLLEQAMQEPSKSFSLRGLLSEILEALRLRTPLSPEAQVRVREESAINLFLNNTITIEPIKGSRLVDVGAHSTDSEMAARIANTLIEVYIQQNLEAKLAVSKDAGGWLAQQLEVQQERVAESEAALQAYKEEHQIISLEDRQNIVMQKLSQLNTAVNNSRIQRISAETQYKQIEQYLDSESAELTSEAIEKLESISLVINNPLIQTLKVELSTLESEYSELLKKFRAKHPNVIAVRSQISSVQDRLDAEIRRIMTSIINEYELAMAQEQQLQAALEDQKREAQELNQKAIAYSILEREVETNKRIYDQLLQRTKETTVTEQLETNNIRIIDQAAIPNYPIAPRKKLNIFLAMVVGSVLGVALAFFFEYLDNSIKTPDDVKFYLSIPFLGFIPKVTSETGTSGQPRSTGGRYPDEMIVARDPKSNASEAYRSLRTNVIFSSIEHGPILLVTSAGPAEGKSLTVANLGITMAQSGSRTLIIDCDLRKPRMHKIFNIPGTSTGFTDMVAKFGTNGNKITIKRTKIPNLDIIPCGKIPPNPSEMLSSHRVRQLLAALGRKYDKILIDSPPVNVVTDPVILSQIAGGVVLIIKAGEAKRDVVRRASEQLTGVGATIIGGVLNNVDVERDNYYYYSYHYNYYYQEEEDEEKFSAMPEA